MRNAVILELSDCTEFSQALRVRPPKLVHGAACLLAALIGAALVWSAMTRASLVVRAPGRVRPFVAPRKVFVSNRGEGPGVGGEVVEVHAREGDEVKEGELLIRLETGRLDSEIDRRRGLLRTSEEELADLTRLDELTAKHGTAAREKALAELTQARGGLRRANEQREADVRVAQVDLDSADDELEQLRALVNRRAAPRADMTKAAFKSREARQKLARAGIPLDEGPVSVAERNLVMVELDYKLKGEELGLKRLVKRGEVEAARIELARLELERKKAEIRAPLGGIVIRGDMKIGDILEPGKPAMELAERGALLFEGSVSTQDAGRLEVGMPARVLIDAFDHQRYGTVDGTVCFLSPDSLTPEGQQPSGQQPAQDSVMNYTVRVSLAGDSVGRGEFHGRLKLGMAGRAELLTGRVSLLSLLLKRIRQSISLN